MSYEFDFSFLREYMPDIWVGIQQTAWMTLVSIVPGFVLGTAAAVARLSGPAWALSLIHI